MRIVPAIQNNLFLQRETFKNNHSDYSQYRVPVLKQDSFTGKSILIKEYSTNEKKAILDLIRHGVTCLCCGKKMIDPADINNMEKSGFFKQKPEIILKGLKKYEALMPPLERRIYRLLCKLNKKYPNKSFKKLFDTKKADIETKLIDKQSKIFGNIYAYGKKHLSEEKFEQLGSIFQECYDEIYGRKPFVTFSRKKFIGLIYKFTKDLNKKQANKILAIAEKMPSSQDMYEAFIMKYSRKNNKEIVMRLIQRAVGTIEHIKPRADGGSDSIYNYALECANDNWNRSSNPMFLQISKNPKMPANAQKQVNQIIELVNQKKCNVDGKYVHALKDALYRESGEIINLDISKLKE